MDEWGPAIRRRKAFICPHCQGLCSIPISIQVLDAEKFIEDEHVTVSDPYQGMTEDQRRIVEVSEKSGLLAAFEVACRRRVGIDVPNNLGRFLITFLKTMRPKRVPAFALRHYADAFHRQIDFYGAQGILAVAADGRLVAFLPLELAAGAIIKRAIGGGKRTRLDAEETDFLDWVKTRNGYVPSTCTVFLKEMQRRSVGDFANVTL